MRRCVRSLTLLALSLELQLCPFISQLCAQLVSQMINTTVKLSPSRTQANIGQYSKSCWYGARLGADIGYRRRAVARRGFSRQRSKIRT